MAVTLVNCFEVPTGREDEFFTLWQEVNEYMRAQPGYLGHTLYRAVNPDASFRFVNVANWESAGHFRASHSDEFRKLVSRPEWTAFTSKPGLYEVVHKGEAQAAAAG
ncbi:MAG: antibiotic biosynthesis monooxygenase family protein [Terriglobia bacterium]|jgi:heme-degrading monooxygenase HmoA|nr:antibiotic biosynthesis monooxygenase family protein [Terriglobia bacterium]